MEHPKQTAKIFLWLACAIMLAFAVLPHHHHHHFICFNTGCCETAETTETTVPHQHDHTTGEGCVKHLFQTKITRSLSLKHSCHTKHCPHFIFHSYFTANLLALLYLQDEDLKLHAIPYREKLHAILYCSHTAGRSPPFHQA